MEKTSLTWGMGCPVFGPSGSNSEEGFSTDTHPQTQTGNPRHMKGSKKTSETPSKQWCLWYKGREDSGDTTSAGQRQSLLSPSPPLGESHHTCPWYESSPHHINLNGFTLTCMDGRSEHSSSKQVLFYVFLCQCQ